MYFFCSGSNQKCHSAINHYVSSLWQLLSLYLLFMTLKLKSSGQVFCRISLGLGSPDVFSWGTMGLGTMGLREDVHRDRVFSRHHVHLTWCIMCIMSGAHDADVIYHGVMLTLITLLRWNLPNLFSHLSVDEHSGWGFPSDAVVKNLPASVEDARHMGLISGSGRSPGAGIGNSLQCSCLENSMDSGAWQATVHGVIRSQKWLSSMAWHGYLGYLQFRACY